MYNYITTIYTTNEIILEKVLYHIRHDLVDNEHFSNINVSVLENNIQIMTEEPLRFTCGGLLFDKSIGQIRVGIMAPDHRKASYIAYRIHTNLWGRDSKDDDITLTLQGNLVQCIFKESSRAYPIFIFE